MMLDKLLDFVVSSVRAEEKARQEKIDEAAKFDLSVPRPAGHYWCVKKAGELAAPCAKKAAHHRSREEHWTKRLEEAEKELREKGVSVEVYDSASQTYMNPTGSLISGAMTGAAIQNFQPRVDQRLLDSVKNCKAKMLEHRSKAENYEKLARAYRVNPEFSLKLNVEEVTYYGLGDE
jgi:hypothetical protein